MHLSRLAPIATVALAACLVNKEGGQPNIRAAIDSANTRWSAAIAAGNADSLRVLFAANARMMPPGAPATVGRDAIVAGFAPMFAIGQWTITLATDTVWSAGSSVFERGTWVSTFTPGPNAPAMPPREKGKYMQRWIQEDGHWVIADDIWNSDDPPPPAAAPAPPPRPRTTPTTRRRR